MPILFTSESKKNKSVRNVAIPNSEPDWNYRTGNTNVKLRYYMVNCLTEAIKQPMV
jgi:hypothetical protein